MEQTFVLATQNPGKQQEMMEILSNLGVKAVLPQDLHIHLDIEENGETYQENAMLKAKAFCEATGLPAIADDSGLNVDALNGAPGIYTARYGGPELNDWQRCMLLLENLRGQTTRAAHFTCCIVCVFPDGDSVSARGEVYGSIAFAPLGRDGFGYDPLFMIPAERKTFAQMSREHKNEISHRGKALRAFEAALRDKLAERTKPDSGKIEECPEIVSNAVETLVNPANEGEVPEPEKNRETPEK